MDAAIESKQWKRAISIVDSLPSKDSARPYLERLAVHFASVQDFDLAEKYFQSCGKPQEAVDMYKKANKWKKAHTLATSFMPEHQVSQLYLTQAKELEAKGNHVASMITPSHGVRSIQGCRETLRERRRTRLCHSNV